MENGMERTDRWEAALRWMAAALGLAFFAGIAACGNPGELAASVSEAVAWEAAPVAARAVVQTVPLPSAPSGQTSFRENYSQGIAAWKNGQLELAEARLLESVKRRPDHVKSRINLARILIERGRFAEARNQAASAAALDPGSGSAHRTLARALALVGHCSRALATYETALWIDPDDRWSLNNMALLLIQHGRFEEAIGPLALAVRLDGDNVLFRNNLGTALEGAGYRIAALEEFAAAATIDPLNAKVALNFQRLRHLADDGAEREVDTAVLGGDFKEELMGAPPRNPTG